MSQDARIKVRSTHRYNATADRIFDTLMDPAKAKKFMFATLTGKMIKAEIDGKPGGLFTFIDRRPEGDAAHYGKYIAVEKPKHISFDFSVQKDFKDADRVSIDIVALKQGCEVTLTHEMKKEFEHLEERVQEGWDGILDGLGSALRT
jgi:uncharacterized protein YndB with AHSA1/START domain